MSTLPHQVRAEAIVVRGSTPKQRGMARAAQIAPAIRLNVAAYEELFTTLGIDRTAMNKAARDSMAAIRDWDPTQHDELLGVATGAGIPPNTLGLIIARTEILTLAPQPATECSTLVYNARATNSTPANPAKPARSTVSAQTWDWKVQLMRGWHFHRVEPHPTATLNPPLTYAGFAEYGMTGKIGMNSAGVGVHLNILKHKNDAPGGVPIHAVLHRILNEATTLKEAVDIVKGATTSASSVITVVTATDAAHLEISPAGVTIESAPGWMMRTNHFCTQTAGTLPLTPDSNSQDRLDYLARATAVAPEPTQAQDLVASLCSPAQEHLVNLLPDDAKPLPERSATLVTVRMDPAQRTITLSPGAPQFAGDFSVTYRL